MLTAQSLLQAALNGVILGMIYVAIAIGLTIIFGMLRLVNFAHGAFYGIGAYVGLVLAQRAGFGAALVVGPIVVALLAVALDRIVLRRFYDKEPTSQILLTFGIAVIVEEALRMIFGGTTQQYPLPPWLGGSIAVAGLQYPAYRIFLAVAILLVVIAVWIFIQRTNYGLIVRAGIRDRTMVQLLGGNVRLASTIIFALGAALAGLVGVAASPIYSIDPGTGFNFLIPSFVVVVIGGLGSFWGAVIGGIIVGELTSMTQLIFPSGADVIIYVAMALVLLFRPQGLLGESEVIHG
ncbi:MAG: branched-chain amino acid ABC transporter permease [Candidatus Velthaea sp.]